MRKPVLIAALIFGIVAALCGPLTGVLLVISTLVRSSSVPGGELVAGALGLSLAAFGLGLGGLLAVAAWRGLAETPGRPASLPHWGLWLTALLLTLIAGQAAFSLGGRGLLPLFHVAAGALPGLLYLAIVVNGARGRRGAPGRRAVAAGLAWGALGSTVLAITIELIFLALIVAVVALWLTSARPELIEQMQAWAAQAQASGQPPDMHELARLATMPGVVALLLLGIGLIVPVIEETAKSLAIPLAGLGGRRLSSLEGFVIGVSAGAGFAMLEGVGNGALALMAPTSWALLMLARASAAAMHCLAAGLAGLGWQAILSEGRWLRGLALGAGAAGLHGIWNVAAGLQGLLSLGSITGDAPSALAQAAFLLPLLSVMGLLWLAAVIALAMIPQNLSQDAADKA